MKVWGESGLAAFMIAGGIAVGAICLGAQEANANGFLENRPWQFDTPSDKIAKGTLLDLREKKEGGFYDSFQVNNHNTYINETNFEGGQVNCYQTASAVGNDGNNTAQGTTSSPKISSSSSVDADAIGNQSDQVTDGPGQSADSGTGISGDSSSGQSGSTLDGSTGQSLSSSQSNTDSPQTADIDDVDYDGSFDTDIDGGTTDVSLNSSQTLTESPQNAYIQDSEACQFYDGPVNGSTSGAIN